METEKSKGVSELHRGFKVGDSLFTPSIFGIAHVSVHRPAKLNYQFEKEKSKILSGETKESQAPLFYELVKSYESKGQNLNINDLREIGKKKFGTFKILDKTSIVPVNKEGHIATFSSRYQASMKINSRRHSGRVSNYFLTLVYPVVKNIRQASRFHSEGGSPHTSKNLLANSFLSRGIDYEENFLENLEKEVEQYYKDNNLKVKLTANDIDHDFNLKLRLVDNVAAQGLTALYYANLHNNTKLFKNRTIDDDEYVLQPFDFRNSPFPIEAFLRHTIGKQNLSEIDKAYDWKSVTPFFKHLYKEGVATINIFPDKTKTHFKQKDIPIIESMIRHFYLKHRRFKGFGIEFPNTPFEATSMIFDGVASEIMSPTNNDLSVRILYDDKTNLPYIMYKNFSIPESEQTTKIGKINPYTKINRGQDRLYGKKAQFWIEKDPVTGKKAKCSLWEPTGEIRKQASKYSKHTGQFLRETDIFSLYSQNKPKI